GFHGGAGEDNTLHLARGQRFGRLGNGEIGFPGSGRADGKGQAAGVDGLHQFALAVGARADILDVFLVAVAVYFVVERVPVAAAVFKGRVNDIVVAFHGVVTVTARLFSHRGVSFSGLGLNEKAGWWYGEGAGSWGR